MTDESWKYGFVNDRSVNGGKEERMERWMKGVMTKSLKEENREIKTRKITEWFERKNKWLFV